MFFLYYIWFFLFETVHFFKNSINNVYTMYNKSNIINKSYYSELSYFEKLFLILFNNKNVFKNTIANLKDVEEIEYVRKNYYPTINSFFIYKNNFNLKINKLKKLIKIYHYFDNKKLLQNNNKNLNIENNFLLFLILQNIFYKNYHNQINYVFYKNNNIKNVYKMNFLYFFFLNSSEKKNINFDLNKYNQWFSYCFNLKIKKTLKNSFYYVDKKKEEFIKKIIKLKIAIKLKKYKNIIKKYNIKNIFYFFNFNKIKNFKIKFLKNLNLEFYKIRFKETSLNKFLNLTSFNNLSIMYLRKNRVFNKSRYSRNRQLYRTGVYWCIWLNIVLVYGLYFLFYRFSFNFGYIWWGLFILLYSTIFSRVLKYNFFNIYYINKEFLGFLKWVGYIFINLIKNIYTFLSNVLNSINLNFFLKKKNFIIKNRFFYKIYKFYKKNDSIKFLEFWKGLKEKDDSIFKYKTILHWFKLSLKILFN